MKVFGDYFKIESKNDIKRGFNKKGKYYYLDKVYAVIRQSEGEGEYPKYFKRVHTNWHSPQYAIKITKEKFEEVIKKEIERLEGFLE